MSFLNVLNIAQPLDYCVTICVVDTTTLFYKQPVYKQLALRTSFAGNFFSWIILSKQQYKIPDIPKMFSECWAVFY